MLCIAGVAAAAATFFVKNMLASGVNFSFYQTSFSPAVMFACGEGLVSPVMFPELLQFLSLETERFTCSSIPTDLKVDTEYQAKAWFYLLGLLGLVWRIMGDVAWEHVAYALALLYSFTMVSIYGIFRLSIENKFIAFVSTLFLLGSSFQLMFLPYYRDFSKAPFILAAIFCLILLLKNRHSTNQLALIGLAFGSIIGIGYGFRPDILIVLPICLFLLAFFLPYQKDWRDILAARFVLISTISFSFVLFALPVILTNESKGSCLFHFPMLGLARQMNGLLSITPATYELVHQYNDSFIHALINAKAQTSFGLEDAGYCSPLYDKISARIYLEYVSTFPADMLTRGLGSAMSIMANSFHLWPVPPLEGGNLDITFFLNAYNYFVKLFATFYFGLATIAIVLFVIALRSIRLCIAVFFLLIYLTFYPAIQAGSRHWFHLQFIPFLLVGIQLYGLYAILREMFVGQKPTISDLKIPILTAGGCVIGLFSTFYIFLYAAQIMQDHQHENLISEYQKAKKSPLNYSVEPWKSPEQSFIRFVKANSEGHWPIAPNVLLLEFNGNKPSGLYSQYQSNVPIELFYPEGPLPGYNFSYKTKVRSYRQDDLFLYVPVYSLPHRQFRHAEGFILPSSLVKDLKGLYVVDGLRDHPLWLTHQITVNKDDRVFNKRQEYLPTAGN